MNLSAFWLFECLFIYCNGILKNFFSQFFSIKISDSGTFDLKTSNINFNIKIKIGKTFPFFSLFVTKFSRMLSRHGDIIWRHRFLWCDAWVLQFISNHLVTSSCSAKIIDSGVGEMTFRRDGDPSIVVTGHLHKLSSSLFKGFLNASPLKIPLTGAGNFASELLVASNMARPMENLLHCFNHSENSTCCKHLRF